MKALLAAAVLAFSAVAAHAGVEAPAGIPGTFDPQTRIFVPAASPVAPAAKASALGGTISYAMTIQIASAIPAGQPILCSATIIHAGLAGAYYSETAATQATRSGAKATCTVKIPYLWAFGNAASFIQPTIMVTVDKRQLTHVLPMIPMPANNASKSFPQQLRF